MSLLFLPLTLLVFAGAVWLARGRQAPSACPDCGGAWEPLPGAAGGQAEEATWEVLRCEACEALEVRVQGSRSAWAWCPACKQRSLEVRAEREAPARASQPSAGGPQEPPAIRVAQRCHLCGHEAEQQLQLAPQRPLARVLPFAPRPPR